MAYVAEATGFPEVYGVDLSDAAAQQARARGVQSIVADIDTQPLPYQDVHFDAVMSTETIEHLYHPDRLLSEMHRTLRPGGLAVLTTPNMAWWVNRLALLGGWQPFSYEPSRCHSVGHPPVPMGMSVGETGHVSTFTTGALTQLMRIHGFEVVAVKGLHLADSVVPEWLAPSARRLLPLEGALGRVHSFSFGTVIAGRK